MPTLSTAERRQKTRRLQACEARARLLETGARKNLKRAAGLRHEVATIRAAMRVPAPFAAAASARGDLWDWDIGETP